MQIWIFGQTKINVLGKSFLFRFRKGVLCVGVARHGGANVVLGSTFFDDLCHSTIFGGARTNAEHESEELVELDHLVPINVDFVNKRHELDARNVFTKIVDDGAELIRINGAIVIGIKRAKMLLRCCEKRVRVARSERR